MKTFQQFEQRIETVPLTTSWYLADLGEARGKLKLAYGEFERRVGQTASPKGAKTELIEAAIGSMTGSFTVADLERACPGVSRDLVRKVLRRLRQAGKVESLGRGPGALWRKRSSTPEKR